jgi:hypothetical protein
MAYCSPPSKMKKTNLTEPHDGGFIRLPPTTKRCPVSGLSRSTLNALVLPTRANDYRPQVVSHVVKTHPLNRRGVRLISVSSLCAYIRGAGGEVGTAHHSSPDSKPVIESQPHEQESYPDDMTHPKESDPTHLRFNPIPQCKTAKHESTPIHLQTPPPPTLVGRRLRSSTST